MEEVTPKELIFPDGLDEGKVDELIQTILDGIDRERLFQDERLSRVRHPLLEERMGRDTALNTEIYNLITDIVIALSASDEIDNKAELLESIPTFIEVLLDSAYLPDALEANLATFIAQVLKLVELNPEDNGSIVNKLVHNLLRKKLTMPSLAQEYILYPPVTVMCSGESRDAALARLEGCKKFALDVIKDKGDDVSTEFRKAVETEAAAVQAWLAKTEV